MLAAVLYGKEDVRVERRELPPIGPGEVRVRVGAALTCGTDVKVFRRGYHARMIRPPAVFGHEFAGEIEAAGEGVTNWQAGQRVVAANSAPCGACFFCGKGLYELCEDLLFLNGAYAEAVTVPARIVEKNLYALPDHVTYEEAALAEPLACVVRGLDETPVRAGETVLVLGLGPIGLLFVRLCARAGAHVIAAGRRAARLALARELGAAEVVDVAALTDPVAELRARTPAGRGADVVIEAVGRPEAWEQAVALARKAGQVSLFGGCPADTVARLDTHRVHYDELTLKGTFHHTPDAFRRALGLLADGSVPARAFVQRSVGLPALPAELAAFARGANDAVKVAVLP